MGRLTEFIEFIAVKDTKNLRENSSHCEFKYNVSYNRARHRLKRRKDE